MGWVGVVLGGCDGSIFIYRSFCLIFFVLRPHTKFQPSSSMRLENIPLSKKNRTTHDTRNTTHDGRHTTPPLPNYSPRGILFRRGQKGVLRETDEDAILFVFEFFFLCLFYLVSFFIFRIALSLYPLRKTLSCRNVKASFLFY